METSSYWGLLLEIFQHERGIPSNCTSSTYGDCVPVLCTHRPSLDPIGCNVEFDRRDRTSSPVAEVAQDFASRGTRSRNKAAVGEPAAGSLLYTGKPGYLREIPSAFAVVITLSLNKPVHLWETTDA